MGLLSVYLPVCLSFYIFFGSFEGDANLEMTMACIRSCAVLLSTKTTLPR